MIYEDEKLTEVENMGFAESVVRASVSIAIVLAVLLIPSITSLTLFGLTQLAIYAGLTAFIGWDPIYAVKKQPAGRAAAETVEAAGTVYSRNKEQASGGDRKKAA